MDWTERIIAALFGLTMVVIFFAYVVVPILRGAWQQIVGG